MQTDVVLEIDVQEPYASFIRNGSKKVEGRLAKEKYRTLQPGNLIAINDEKYEVINIRIYSTFEEMIQNEGIKNVIPEAKDLESAVNVYYKFYTPEEEQKYQVIAIEIKPKNG